MTLENKVILVTGATAGIGEASAHYLAEIGAKVIVLGRTPEKVEETVKNIGENAFGVVADVSNAPEIERAIAQGAAHFGRLDGVIANAGTNGVWASIEEISPDEWDKTLEVNLRGTFLSVKYAIPHLKKHGGAVVIVSSVNGTRMFSNVGASAYASSKAAQVAFAKMAALELAKHKIRVNAICPGAIQTEIETKMETRDLGEIREPVEFPDGKIPLTDGQPGEARQVAQLVGFLMSDLSSHISGSEMWIDGAQSLLQG